MTQKDMLMTPQGYLSALMIAVQKMENRIIIFVQKQIILMRQYKLIIVRSVEKNYSLARFSHIV